jgi:hypothetical protein
MSSEYPSWRDLIAKERMFDKEVSNKLSKPSSGQSDKNQIIETAFRSSLHILPSPFNSIAESVYDSVDGYEREKLGEVRSFLHVMTKKGENHYLELVSRLGKVTSDVLKLKNDAARKSTLLYIRDILAGKSNNVDQRLYRIAVALEDITDY